MWREGKDVELRETFSRSVAQATTPCRIKVCAELSKEKTKDVGMLLDGFIEGGSHTVARSGGGPKQDGAARRIGGLEPSGHFAGLHRIDTDRFHG
jgi:hypothetical protein